MLNYACKGWHKTSIPCWTLCNKLAEPSSGHPVTRHLGRGPVSWPITQQPRVLLWLILEPAEATGSIMVPASGSWRTGQSDLGSAKYLHSPTFGKPQPPANASEHHAHRNFSSHARLVSVLPGLHSYRFSIKPSCDLPCLNPKKTYSGYAED